MAANPRHSLIVAHIEAVARRSADAAEALVATMLERAWPTGAGDRTEPLARLWVQRWRAAPGGPAAPACGCAHGACLVCN